MSIHGLQAFFRVTGFINAEDYIDSDGIYCTLCGTLDIETLSLRLENFENLRNMTEEEWKETFESFRKPNLNALRQALFGGCDHFTTSPHT